MATVTAIAASGPIAVVLMRGAPKHKHAEQRWQRRTGSMWAWRVAAWAGIVQNGKSEVARVQSLQRQGLGRLICQRHRGTAVHAAHMGMEDCRVGKGGSTECLSQK